MPPRPARLTEGLPVLPIGDAGQPGDPDVIALANNENVEMPSAAVLAACARAAAASNWYPDITAAELRTALAARHGLDARRLVVGVGAGELIALLAQAYCNPGDEVVIGQHGYLYFGIASQAVGARVVRAAAAGRGNELGFDVDAALDAVTPRTRIVFLDNPGNPLGTHVGADALRALREALPDKVLLVLDCAYGDYATADDYRFGHELVDTRDDTVVVRTFSKIYALAGMRIGWAHAPPGVAETMLRVARPGNVSRVALAGAEAALAEPALIAARRERNARLRTDFSRRLADELGLAVNPSQANFVLVTLPHGGPDAARMLAGLQARRILVRPMAPYSLPDSLRITIGSQDHMDRVTHAMADIMRGRA